MDDKKDNDGFSLSLQIRCGKAWRRWLWLLAMLLLGNEALPEKNLNTMPLAPSLVEDNGGHAQ